VLRRAVVPKFEKAFADRTEAIQGGMERAEKAQREAEAALTQYKTQLADARGEAQQIREEARVQGAAIMEEMRAKPKMKLRESPQQRKQQLRPSVNKRLTHFAMRWELWQPNWHPRSSEKHLMTRSGNLESSIDSSQI